MRGLKYAIVGLDLLVTGLSHPAWDAWIEITNKPAYMYPIWHGRIPHGMRGLKSSARCGLTTQPPSHPAWDAWIEIPGLTWTEQVRKSHPAWDAWIEIAAESADAGSQTSHPAWDAWIEMLVDEPAEAVERRIPHGMRGLKLPSFGNQLPA